MLGALFMLRGLWPSSEVIDDYWSIFVSYLFEKMGTHFNITELTVDKIFDLFYYLMPATIRPSALDVGREEVCKAIGTLIIVGLMTRALRDRGVSSLVFPIEHVQQEMKTPMKPDWFENGCGLNYSPSATSGALPVTFWRPTLGRATGIALMVGKMNYVNKISLRDDPSTESFDWSPDMQYGPYVGISKRLEPKAHRIVGRGYSGQVMRIAGDDEEDYPSEIRVIGLKQTWLGGSDKAYHDAHTLLGHLWLGNTPLINTNTITYLPQTLEGHAFMIGDLDFPVGWQFRYKHRSGEGPTVIRVTETSEDTPQESTEMQESKDMVAKADEAGVPDPGK
jgi:hypothetical protein